MPTLITSFTTLPAVLDEATEWFIVLELESQEIGAHKVSLAISGPNHMPFFSAGHIVDAEATIDGKWGFLNVTFPMKGTKIESPGEYCGHVFINGNEFAAGRFEVQLGL